MLYNYRFQTMDDDSLAGELGEDSRHTDRAMGDREDRRRVFIQLSGDQVDRVIAHNGTAEGSAADVVGSAPKGGYSTQWVFRPLMEDKGYSRSLLIGLEVLTCFPLDGTERGVADVAHQLKMTNSTVHRYMTTLLRLGLLERNPETRWYRVSNARRGDAVD